MLQNGRNYKETIVNVECRCESEMDMYKNAISVILDLDRGFAREIIAHALCILADNPKRGITFAIAFAIDTHKHATTKRDSKEP